MSENVYYTVEWTINDGQLGAFEALVEECNAKVREHEPKMLDYHWYTNADKSAAYLCERHTDSDSMLFHIENIGELLQKLLGVSKISRFEVFGNPSDKAAATFTAMGGQLGLDIETFPHHSGFTR